MNFSNQRHSGKNITGITIVVLLHALVAYGIVTGLGKRMVTKMAEVVETKIIEEVKMPAPQDFAPPPPPPEMSAPPPPFIPPVEVNIQQPPPPKNVIAAAPAKPVKNDYHDFHQFHKFPPLMPVAPAAPPSAAPLRHTPAVADFSTCAKPEWPKSSLRNEEAGTVTLSFLIGVDGTVADSRIVRSSGFRELDKAAINGVGKCRFKPATLDGKPEQAWMLMQYVWVLE